MKNQVTVMHKAGVAPDAIARALEISLETVLAIIDGNARRDAPAKAKARPAKAKRKRVVAMSLQAPRPRLIGEAPRPLPSDANSTDSDRVARHWARRGYPFGPPRGDGGNRML